jgi:hypothetical protein
MILYSRVQPLSSRSDQMLYLIVIFTENHRRHNHKFFFNKTHPKFIIQKLFLSKFIILSNKKKEKKKLFTEKHIL